LNKTKGKYSTCCTYNLFSAWGTTTVYGKKWRFTYFVFNLGNCHINTENKSNYQIIIDRKNFFWYEKNCLKCITSRRVKVFAVNKFQIQLLDPSIQDHTCQLYTKLFIVSIIFFLTKECKLKIYNNFCPVTVIKLTKISSQF
jgi:hypothetical protein